MKANKPNKAVQPTPTRVTPPASSLRSGQEARHGQPSVIADVRNTYIEAICILVFALYVASLIHVWKETKKKHLGNPITTTLMVAICFWPLPYLSWVFYWPGSFRSWKKPSDVQKIIDTLK
jgi:hypothetical protein